MTYAESRRLYGGETFNTPSRFVREIPSDLIEEVRLGSSVARPLSSLTQTESAAGDLSLGQRVMHAVFGEGIVTNFEGRGASARVEVSFAEGSKWLVLQYANLQLL